MAFLYGDSHFHFEDTEENSGFFLPEDLGREQGVGRQVLREDLVVADKVLCGLPKLGSSCDAPRQPVKIM